MSDSPAPARPSASVVIAHSRDGALEVLMLRRNQDVAFHGGAWVFPGGRVDPEDAPEGDLDTLDAARRAAARECQEEAGIDLDTGGFLPFAHWTTPTILPKRFATWFFLAPVDAATPVTVDHSEIIDYQWITPADALARHREGEIDLPAPTFVTLLKFGAYASLDALATDIGSGTPDYFAPRVIKIDGGRCTVYAEDAAYASLDFDAPGPRHRLVMVGHNFEYQRDF